MTQEEGIGLKATLHAIDNPEFQCGKCISKYASRPDYEQMNARSQKVKGCEVPYSMVVHKINLDDKGSHIGFKRCIGNFFDASSIGWMEAERAFQNGVMPFPGSFTEQPAKVIEVFSVISSYRNDKIKELQEQERRKTKQSQGVRGRKLG